MADITLTMVEPSRAVAEIEVEQSDSITIEAPIRFPFRQGLNFPELQTVITPLNEFALDYGMEVASQVQATGYITFDFYNRTVAAPGDMGRFRVEVRKTRG
jgi:hypothetical protein